MGITEIRFYFCLRFRCQFGHTKLGDWRGFFLKKGFSFGFKGVVEKCAGCFLIYLFFFFFAEGGGVGGGGGGY